jgi:hypothetical protein
MFDPVRGKHGRAIDDAVAQKEYAEAAKIRSAIPARLPPISCPASDSSV